MQRLVATLLIALVGVMALMPQALCPCAQRARAQEAVARAQGATAPAPRACCERCLARAAAAAQTPAPPTSDAPPSCPCCEVNGKGKNLLEPGPSVRTPDLAPAGFAADPALGTPRGVPALARVAGDAVDDPPLVAPPAVTRAGVVLLI